MSAAPHSGPAFPVVFEHSDATSEHFGMDLRDYFAAKAMQAEYAAIQANKGCALYRDVAERAYILADAMLEARQ